MVEVQVFAPGQRDTEIKNSYSSFCEKGRPVKYKGKTYKTVSALARELKLQYYYVYSKFYYGTELDGHLITKMES